MLDLPTSAAAEYHRRGFVSVSRPLADASVIPALLADEPLFARAIAGNRARGLHQVPYIITDAVRHVAQDRAILSTVCPILGTEDWVMWGPNIQRATPNEAHLWHTDLESLYWPTITVAVGLSGCTPQSATWFQAEEPEQIAGFGDGHFYVFNARTRHRGDPNSSRDRVVLLFHYQRAQDPRIPLMLDYERNLWAPEASPFYSTIPAERIRRDVAPLPLACRLVGRWARGVRAAVFRRQ